MYREDALKLTSDVLPRFGEMQITKIAHSDAKRPLIPI
jgi:hypothetical protein